MSGPRPFRTRRFPRWATIVVVVVLAAVVIVLTTLAITRTQAEPAEGTPRPVPVDTETATPSASAPSSGATSTPRPTSTLPASPLPGAAERFLAVGANSMWRATAGSCGVTAPVLERSDDGGRTWNDVTPAYLGVAQILALEPFAGDEAQIVARVGTGCEVQALRTFTQGRFWESYPEVLAASTYVNPSDPGSVVSPRGPIAAPCPAAWGLRAVNDTVGLVCDGTAYQLGNGGWTPVATDAVAVAVREGSVIAAHTAAGCSGLSVGRACTGLEPPYSPAAIAAGTRAVYQWIGQNVLQVPAA